MNVTISVFDYLAISDFFEDYLSLRKSLNPVFSYQVWATELGVSSRSYLRSVVTGRRAATVTFIQKFIEKNSFSEDEKEFLQTLANLSQSKTSNERKALNQRLVQIARKHAVHSQNLILEPEETFLKDLFLPRLFIYLTFTDVPKTTEEIAQAWSKERALIEVKLKNLNELGLIEKNNKNEWQTKKDSFAVPDRAGNTWLRAFHRETLSEGMTILENLPKNRRFRSLLFSLDQDQYQDFVEMSENFLKELEIKFSSKTYSGKELLQLSLQAYPVHASIQKRK